jgi:hypothetical protein
MHMCVYTCIHTVRVKWGHGVLESQRDGLMWMHVCMCVYTCIHTVRVKWGNGVLESQRDGLTAIPIIIEGRFQVFQRFSSSKLVLKTVESCFAALNYYGNGSMWMHVCKQYGYIDNRLFVHTYMHVCVYACTDVLVYVYIFRYWIEANHPGMHACCVYASFRYKYIRLHMYMYNGYLCTFTLT